MNRIVQTQEHGFHAEACQNTSQSTISIGSIVEKVPTHSISSITEKIFYPTRYPLQGAAFRANHNYSTGGTRRELVKKLHDMREQ
jgi:hypothetical protein